ncbi:MAG: hypothetical protein EON61_17590 [Alphaproteobacteria bacterium]|nr:MAG: hypothetical protein EON61_17590 [Alphaproteobacteria bacterium]
MRSIKTEGAVAQRRRDGCGFALEAFGALFCETFVVVEVSDEAFEAPPDRHRGSAGMCVGEVRDEAGIARDDACDLAGAEIDQQVELGVGVAHGGGDAGETCGIGADVGEGVIVGEHRKADFDHVM